MAKGKSKSLRKIEAQEPQLVDPTQKSNSAVIASQYSGPLPPPSLMKQYNDIHPDFADRIFATWEKETAHRHKLETMAVESEIINEQAVSGDVKRGQWLAFVLSISFLGAGVFLAAIGMQVSGVIFGTSGFLGIIMAFLNTAFKSRDNNHNNAITKIDEE